MSGNESSFNTMFNPNIELPKDKVYEIALVNLETYNSFPNIDETNNVFVYSPNNGSYEIEDLNNTIRFKL